MGQSNLAVTCCLWSDWPEPGWAEEYAYRLYRGVQRHLSLPHEFVCFADDPGRLKDAPFEVRPLNAISWKGCLPKLYVYSEQAGLSGRVLLLDMDNVITGSLDDIASYDGPLCVRAWFQGWDRGLRDKVAHPSLIDGDMIAFDARESRHLWDTFAADPERFVSDTGGRERFYLRGQVTPDLWQELLPGQIVSWKNHMRDGRVPKDARIVSMHGNPRPHKLDQDWLKEHWT